MGKLQWGQVGNDSALVALFVGGIAMALGGAALFGMVAHTWTPFLPQKGGAVSPFDSIARVDSIAQAAPTGPSTELIPRRKRSFSIPWDPRPDEFQAAQAAPAVAPTLAAVVIPPALATVPPDSLRPGESAVFPEEQALLSVALAPPPAIVMAEPPPAETKLAEAPYFEPRAVVIRVADVKVAGSNGGRAMATDVRVVELPPPEPKVAKARPVEPRRADPKPVEPRAVEPKVLEAKRPEVKPAPTRIAEAKRPEPKPAPAKIAEAKAPPPKAAPQRVAEAKRVEPKRPEAKPVVIKVAEKAPEPRRIEPKATPVKAVAVKPVEAPRPEIKRVVDTKPAEARAAEAKRLAEAKAAQARVAEAKLAEAKRAAEIKAAEWKLAEMTRAAELKATEAKLAASQRAFEAEAAESKLAETKRALEATMAETKLAESRLDAKRTADLLMSLAKRAGVVKPAVDTKPAVPRYEQCESCGTVTAVLRYRERGSFGWEVRVDFGSGPDRTFDYSSDPGLSIGDRVRYEGGRITRHYPRRNSAYSPT